MEHQLGNDPHDGGVDPPDHRRLGRLLGIFASDEQCGSGLPLWLPAGAVVRSELERYIVDLERRHGYQHVYTPMMAKRELYERSGHWQHYHEDMYPPMEVGADEVVLRPMNCPHHILVFQHERPSSRQLPYRLAELGTMFRYERSGVVGGLSRVRQMTLNDGHVFCLPEQIEAEIADIVAMVEEAYRALAIPAPLYRLSLPGDGPKYVADPGLWRHSEEVLRSVLVNLGLPFEAVPGEAAFYGPKIDLQVSDPQGRQETLSTIQVDFHLPSQFGLAVQQGPQRVQPVMIHRSIISTMERMVAHLLEVHDGAMPLWLAPLHVRVVPIVDDADTVVAAASSAVDGIRARGLRVELDDRPITLNAKIREAQQARVPYVAVVGRREATTGDIAIRRRDGRRLDPMPVGMFAETMSRAVSSRSPATPF